MATKSLVFPQPKQADKAIIQGLQDVLTSTYGAYLATHNYHWNVEGTQFVSLHSLFEQQYNALFQAIDVIAERIRALGDYALPFEGENIVHALRTISNALNKETDASARGHRMVQNLLVLNENAVAACQTAKHSAQKVNDDESENLMVERITAHQKALWLLRSNLK